MTELEEIILNNEKELLRPEVRCSADKIADLMSESFFEFESSGKIYNYRVGDTFPSGPVSEGDWEILDFNLFQVSLDSVLATYKAVKHSEPDISKRVSVRCSLWEKEMDVWKVKFHQAAIADQPEL